MKQINDYTSRHLTAFALVLLLAGLLCVPAVSAYEYEETKSLYDTFTIAEVSSPYAYNPKMIIYNIQNFHGLQVVYWKPASFGSASTLVSKPSYQMAITATIDGTVIGEGTANYNALFNSGGSVIGVQLWLDFDYFDPKSYTGTKTVTITPASGNLFNGITLPRGSGSPKPTAARPIMFGSATDPSDMLSGYFIYRASHTWKNTLVDGENTVELIRNFDNGAHQSSISIIDEVQTLTDTAAVDKTFFVVGPYTWTLTNPFGTVYSGSYGDDAPGEEPTVLRKGTVTMTDNNGTTIRGFEVTAVNAYTDESYTVATETDVVGMTLPMDRTIEIRNPQTGEYEEAPVGYYRFYGQSPGYKMLHDDGIKVSVMPEKYGSYQLCDIRVTQESGYLTGKHHFQIRSRSDNSILQTGTISAKSATTGEWYNTTVTDGIASLILPYDTANSISQYAGNYYVYATSPGYEDSDYGTQIVVIPHTVSEIRDIHLTPIGGIPTHGNVTLRIQAFSETGQGVANANIFISGVHGAGASVWDRYTASSSGYLTVSVPGNSTYDIVASGTGYYDSARRVEVFDNDPPLIEIKLYLSGAPTVEPTTQPTGWVTAPPTTTPPIQEDNLIGLSVKGLAKGFGIDYDTALLMFGLMIVFGAGGIVMSSVKGGAMEFIAGSIVGTFVAFALGLIPIWIFIIIAVVFGAYVLRVFIQGGQ